MRCRFALEMCFVVLLIGGCVLAQAKPTEYHSASEIKQDFANLADQAKSKNAGSSGDTLGKYENHSLQLSYRRETGKAEVHVHLTDIMFVTAGSATIVTGGTLIDPKNKSENEITGKSIDGGTKQVLSAGDVIHIPATTPHQLILDRGDDFRALVIKVHD